MPSISQQDYLRIKIADEQNITAAEKAELQKAVSAGTIFDYIIQIGEGTGAWFTRVACVSDDGLLYVADNGGAPTGLQYLD